jgi:hypothetical protein
MVVVELLHLAEMGMLTRHFTYEEALFFLPSLCRRSQQIVRLQQKQWLPRTAAWELQKTLRRVRHQYGGFNGDRELRCMELFVRLLHELHATHVVQFSTSDKQENRCLLGFTSIELGEQMVPVFHDRCLQLVRLQAAFSDPDLQYFSMQARWTYWQSGAAYNCVCELLGANALKPHLPCRTPGAAPIDDDDDGAAPSTTQDDEHGGEHDPEPLQQWFDDDEPSCLLSYQSWRFENSNEHKLWMQGITAGVVA